MQTHDLPSFHRHLQAAGRRPATCEAYVHQIAYWQRSAGGPLNTLTSADARAHLTQRASELGASAFNVCRHGIIWWFRFTGQPLDLRGIGFHRRAKQPPRWLSAAAASRLLNAVDNRIYRMALQTALATGLRASELRDLRPTDIDKDHPRLHVRCGKGGDARITVVSDTLRQRLRDYWCLARPKVFLFELRPGRPISSNALNGALKKAASAIGFRDHISLHRLRHTFARQMLDNGVSIVELQSLLGHRCIESTLRYLTPDDTFANASAIDLLARLEVQA